MRRAAGATLLAGAGIAACFWLVRDRAPAAHGAPVVAGAPREPGAPAPGSALPGASADESCDAASRPGDRVPGRALRLPSGAPAALSCRDARRIVAQARSHLASEPDPVDARALADATADWLDPHGLWSAAPDAPVAALLRRRAADLVRELEATPEAPGCGVADEAGASLAAWIASLAPSFDEAAQRAEAIAPAGAWRVAAEPAFEDRAVAIPARDLARDLGHRVGTVARSFGDPLRPFAQAARDRFLPSLAPSAWSRVVLAAAVRAYMPLIDPHGGWAPLDEETSLYESDLAASAPRRLWQHMVRTPFGARAESGTAAPLAPRDLVLEVATIPTAGLSVEQVEQLAVFDDTDAAAARPLVVLREGEGAPRILDVPPPPETDPEADPSGVLATDRIAFGEGDVLVVTVADVPDELGDQLAVTIARARAERPPAGIVLDLRGNGGGSTDGANAAIGLFLPGVPLFPMRRRDGVVEMERAPEPPVTDRWTGPVATLVDGDTASAAEMIAGALASYRRGVVAGARTYGKGCAQEYLDDDARGGLLRLTTLVFALPDGTPVQRVGLLPALQLAFPAAGEREAALAHALATWRGPDVRDAARVGEAAWPPHHGRVGPCRDEATCRALRALGAPRNAVARGAGARSASGGPAAPGDRR